MFENIRINLRRFLKSIHFLKAVVMAFAMAIPILLSNFYFGSIEFGFSIALGVIFCAPSDIPGSLKHKIFGMLGSIALAFIATLVIGSVIDNLIILLPMLTLFIFGVSYISVFGFRASLIAVSGLLAIVLAFAHSTTEMSVFKHSLLVGAGGFWFLGLTMLVSFFLPKIQTDYLFVEVFTKTAEFLKIRGRLLVEKENRNDLFKEMFKLQTTINEHHEEIRSLILSERLTSGYSNRTRRAQLVFSKLIEIFELAISNPVDYNKFDLIFEDHQEKLNEFKNIIFEIANQLDHISRVILKEEKLVFNRKISILLRKIQTHIDYYRVLVGLPKSREGTILLLNLKTYQEQQAQNLKDIERVLNNYTHNDNFSVKDPERFITPQDYDLKKLKANFSLKSPIFRHSLRLTITMMIGFLIGQAFEMQNSYWILLTLVVIMRPSYGLTKQRSKHRVIGTLIGAAIGVGIVLITQNPIVYVIVAVTSLIIGFSLVKLNYKSAAIFITLYVIFMYALIHPNILSVIKFRVFDTLIGAALAFIANYVLLPSWEAKNIKEFFINSVEANINFLKEIDILYHVKGNVSTNYKLSRKEAFLQVGNLNAAYQRLVQEPKSKQSNLSVIYELVTVCNTFLSSLSSLGMFIRTNTTKEVPEHFETYIYNIISNLENVLKLLNSEISAVSLSTNEVEKARKIYDDYFSCLSDKRDKEIEEGKPIADDLKIELRETKLVSEQVKWLYNLSKSLVKNVQLITLDQNQNT
ncbi:FUSC family membrane protein [Lutibacter sp. TH_r2]|uniref:FUSC family protein n=1 Tax=Lutibacter sp. TH_r2 TaxID=3082083 RepID=UPI0029548453|nr:FUSC family protein [Lutibacter sp. TH_r2]MDV7185804.1 FUSC family membrane protein [Lutibacter sp. TH_r2]